jgi:uncharacterized protein YdeI (YjbR/CyaY-like superfamily)
MVGPGARQGAPGAILFFASPGELRAWLEEHHESARELWVGFRKKGSGMPSISWPEAVDQALCFGWIDGVRKSLDETSYVIRFTPRRAGSVWSAVNARRAAELAAGGLMHPAGLAAFERRDRARERRYSYEQARGQELADAYVERFRAHPEAWAFFSTQAPSYRRTASWWVMSARRESTRQRRLERLIEASAEGQRPSPFPRARGSA